jgi:hypothetical protein
VNSHTTAEFRKAFAKLPPDVQRQARRTFRQFQRNPDHPGINFKPVHPNRSVYSVRVGRGYRAVGIWEGEEMIWYWIGSHADYDRLIEQWKRR